MTESLKSCPFCGGTANIATGIIEFWAYCPHCGAKTELYETEQEAADSWNRRNETELHGKIRKLEAENKRLREALEIYKKALHEGLWKTGLQDSIWEIIEQAEKKAEQILKGGEE